MQLMKIWKQVEGGLIDPMEFRQIRKKVFIAIAKQGKFLKFFCKSLVTILNHKNNIENNSQRDDKAKKECASLHPNTFFFNLT